jgi:hypothetical protein
MVKVMSVLDQFRHELSLVEGFGFTRRYVERDGSITWGGRAMDRVSGIARIWLK